MTGAELRSRFWAGLELRTIESDQNSLFSSNRGDLFADASGLYGDQGTVGCRGVRVAATASDLQRQLVGLTELMRSTVPGLSELVINLR